MSLMIRDENRCQDDRNINYCPGISSFIVDFPAADYPEYFTDRPKGETDLAHIPGTHRQKYADTK